MTTGVSYSYYFLQLIPQISDGRKYLKTFSLYSYSRIFCHVSTVSSYIYFTFVKTLMTKESKWRIFSIFSCFSPGKCWNTVCWSDHRVWRRKWPRWQHWELPISQQLFGLLEMTDCLVFSVYRLPPLPLPVFSFIGQHWSSSDFSALPSSINLDLEWRISLSRWCWYSVLSTHRTTNQR